MSKDQKPTVSATDFMKKQAATKAVKAKDLKSLKKIKIDEAEAEEKEALMRAKNESKAMAADYNKAEMIKKLILENIVRYTALMILLICTALAAIKIVPAFIQFIYEAIRSFFSL